MRSIFIAGLIVGSAAAQLQAQSTPTSRDSMRALELIAQAEKMTDLGQRDKVARMFEEAGKLLPATDPLASSALVVAANAWYNEGRPVHAEELLERSAELAAARGSDLESAQHLIMAIFVASARHDRPKAQLLKDRALALVAHSDIPEAERIQILRRLTGPVLASTKK